MRALVEGAEVIVCCGSGGVGKTTIAAAVALRAAHDGRRVVVVTIDPARRLADAFGLPDGLGNSPTAIDGIAGPGSLSAMMLDAGTTFDELVHRFAPSPAHAQRIVDNTFYRNIAGSLSGTHEYMAAEKLHQLHDDARFDLVVVDTPPTRQALDFLAAPGRLVRFLEHPVFRLLMMPARRGLKVFNLAAQPVLRTIGKVIGGDVLADAIAFFQAFDGMDEGFRRRAQSANELLHSSRTSFVVVASARRDTIDEACFSSIVWPSSGSWWAPWCSTGCNLASSGVGFQPCLPMPTRPPNCCGTTLDNCAPSPRPRSERCSRYSIDARHWSYAGSHCSPTTFTIARDYWRSPTRCSTSARCSLRGESVSQLTFSPSGGPMDNDNRTAYRTCPLCEAGCGLEITVTNGAVTRIRGDRHDVFSKGFICPKGSTLKQLHEDPDWLRRPVVKRDGVFVEVDWDEAFAEIGERMLPLLQRYGRNAAGVYLGNPSAHSLAPMLFGRTLIHALGTRNRFSASTVDQRPKEISSALMFGSVAVPVPDLDRTDFIVLIGANPYASNGSLCTAPGFPDRLEAIQARGGTVVVVDPRRSETALKADRHLAIRPGTDAHLLAAMANTMLAEGLADPSNVAEHCLGLDDLPTMLAPFTAESVAPACGISPEAILSSVARFVRRAECRDLRAHRHLHPGVRHRRFVAGRCRQRALR